MQRGQARPRPRRPAQPRRAPSLRVADPVRTRHVRMIVTTTSPHGPPGCGTMTACGGPRDAHRRGRRPPWSVRRGPRAHRGRLPAGHRRGRRLPRVRRTAHRRRPSGLRARPPGRPDERRPGHRLDPRAARPSRSWTSRPGATASLAALGRLRGTRPGRPRAARRADAAPAARARGGQRPPGPSSPSRPSTRRATPASSSVAWSRPSTSTAGPTPGSAPHPGPRHVLLVAVAAADAEPRAEPGAGLPHGAGAAYGSATARCPRAPGSPGRPSTWSGRTRATSSGSTAAVTRCTSGPSTRTTDVQLLPRSRGRRDHHQPAGGRPRARRSGGQG